MQSNTQKEPKIKHIYVFRTTGEPIYAKNFQEIDLDSTLITGFLSAIQAFAKNISHETVNINEMQLGKYKILFKVNDEDQIITALFCEEDLEVDKDKLSNLCEFIERTVIENMGGGEINFTYPELINKLLNAAPKMDKIKKHAQIPLLKSKKLIRNVSTADLAILSMCDGKHSIKEIAEKLNRPFFEVLNKILEYKNKGILELKRVIA
ncbi:MAG: hypothetical protein ACTSSJ_05160 [Candidatus Odinarchaeia archaeon]